MIVAICTRQGGNYVVVMTPIEQQKAEFRALAAARRRDVPDNDEASRRIAARLFDLPEFGGAETVMLYLDVRDEVRTRWLLPQLFDQGKTVVVPFCQGRELNLFRLEGLDELETGAFGILEPRLGLRSLPEKLATAEQLDAVVVPGVAFDRRGARLGYGRGFYDRLLPRVRPDVALIGLAFECQMFAELPAAEHDVFMDRVITEAAVYDGRRHFSRLRMESPA